jgi:hypothetical protein
MFGALVFTSLLPVAAFLAPLLALAAAFLLRFLRG